MFANIYTADLQDICTVYNSVTPAVSAPNLFSSAVIA